MTYPPPPGYDPKAQAKADKAYRKAQRPWYRKKRFLIPLALLALFFVSSVFGASNDGTPSATVTPSGGEAVPAAPAQADDAPPAFPGATESDVVAKPGDAVTTDTGVTMTAAPLKVTKSQLGGKPLLCTDVAYQNGSNETASFNGGFDWKVQDPNGAILMNTFSGSDNALNSGELAPGGRTAGQVCFESADASAKGTYIVLLDPSFRFGSERIAWINQM